ncbi:MAG TPA: aminotransferase class I/II-fold pyridoxal phosphate-dependent enzyme [Solirubrobacteraceae bacterium]
MRTAEERLAVLDDVMTEGAAKGLLLRTPDDEPLNGRTLSLEGTEVVNFGSCSYLGLEMDPRLRQGVVDAVMRYGTQFSSSRSYLSAPPYVELEGLLDEMFGGSVLVAPTTSLGHLATLPVLVGSRDAIVLDHQVHASVQTAANQLRLQGVDVEVIRHNRMDRLEGMIEKLRRDHDRIWFMADGVYSMFADFAPFAELRELLDRYEQLHLYVDDSHGVGWAGRHGRGPALDALGGHPRLIVAGSLNKSFAAAGGALVFPEGELRRKVRTVGGPMIFSGPVQPPMLGAALASARIHLSDELPLRQAALRERIELFDELLEEFCLPTATRDVTPIRYLPLGLPRVAHDAVASVLGDGYFTNLGTFPAVPMKHMGVRVTITLHHRPEDIRGLVDSLARRIPEAIVRGGEAAQRRAATVGGYAVPALRLEHHRSVDDLDAAEWDRLLGDRGTFDADGLRFLERAFSGGERPEDKWDFHYYVVRDSGGRPVLATFFTAALWKDDMLSAAAVSELVERRREEDPYYLTSRTFAMGSLLTEGDHLYLDRNADWRGALDVLLAAVSEHAEAEGATTMVLRDLYGSDRELAEALRERGYVGVRMLDSLVLEPVDADDEAWLARIGGKARWHQRRHVLPWDEAFDVEFVGKGGRELSDEDLDHLYELYLGVADKGLDLNTFRLPRTVLRDMLAHDGWELMLLTPREGGRPDGRPVLFGAMFRGARHYAPMVVGLDYDFVESHHSYRQGLRQAMLRARALGSRRMPLGMGARLEKRRFGAEAQERVAFVQTSDHYSQEVLTAFAADARSASA